MDRASFSLSAFRTRLYIMRKEDIITIPNPKLRQRSARVRYIDGTTKQLAMDMIQATLDWEASRTHETGAALAAVQVSALQRVVIVRDDFEDKSNQSFSVFINPEITKAEGEPVEELEGCLSVESLYGKVMRYPRVKVRAKNLDGKEVRLTAEGFTAQVFQHEIDHTNGIVFVDRISDPAKLFHLTPEGNFVTITDQPLKQ